MSKVIPGKAHGRKAIGAWKTREPRRYSERSRCALRYAPPDQSSEAARSAHPRTVSLSLCRVLGTLINLEANNCSGRGSLGQISRPGEQLSAHDGVDLTPRSKVERPRALTRRRFTAVRYGNNSRIILNSFFFRSETRTLREGSSKYFFF